MILEIFCGENLKSFFDRIEIELKQIKNRMKTEIKTKLEENWNKILARRKRKINFIIFEKRKMGRCGKINAFQLI